MKLPRRQFLHLAAGAAALPVVSRIARAQSYPSRPVHWIVSFAAGGPNDIVARIVGQYLSDHLGQQFVIENRAGAAGNVGMQSALNSAPDGYTIAFVGPNYAINPALYEKLPFDFIRDSVPVAGIMRLANVMDVTPTFPANNLAEFIAYAKANLGNQHGFGRHREPAACCRRAVQDDGRRRHGPRSLPRRCARAAWSE
jgi:tripartite-type tricarboxylate transporter receptor subunit TctC